jgi:uncharacterized protein YqjF (DUF2071 family)
MKMPSMQGVIERRLLLNYRVDPDLAATLVPAPFTPQLVHGHAVAGICLIRLSHMRPAGLPAAVGRASDNAAYRVAVEWDDADGTHTGVYVPGRYSGSALNVAAGGRLFPGVQRRADFRVTETDESIAVAFAARDGSDQIDVAVAITPQLTGSELFADTDEASAFFRSGGAGLSPTRDAAALDHLELHTDAWSIEAARVEHARSSWFDDATAFPPGTIALDSALVMRQVPVTWRGTRQPAGMAGGRS